MNNAIKDQKHSGGNKQQNKGGRRQDQCGRRQNDRINEKERKKEERIKRNEDNLRDLWGNVKHPTFESQESQKKKTKRNTMRKYLRRKQLKTSLK